MKKLLATSLLLTLVSVFTPAKAHAGTWTDHGWYPSYGGSIHCYQHDNNLICDGHPYAGGVNWSILNVWMPTFCEFFSIYGNSQRVYLRVAPSEDGANKDCVPWEQPSANQAFRNSAVWPWITGGYADYHQSFATAWWTVTQVDWSYSPPQKATLYVGVQY